MIHHYTHRHSSANRPIIFAQFPTLDGLYHADVEQISHPTIERFGIEEWRAAVLTGELHGHLGIYAILGVKMGLYAVELFGDKRGSLQVTSYAGYQPPVSCLNDGVQVATGATLGHGSIKIEGSKTALPMARFRWGDHEYELELKESYKGQIRHDIEEGINRFGVNSPGYWAHIRSCALRYWSEWDRSQIFTVRTQD